MSVRIYSTLTGHEDELVPLHPDGVLRMYVCGMTPKYHPHVGHGRVFVAMDVIRRYLLWRGYKLTYVQNFTDVDDKIIERAAREGRAADTTAQSYIDSYFEVMDRLNIRRADEYPTVTGYMERIVEFTAGLIESNNAYSSESWAMSGSTSPRLRSTASSAAATSTANLLPPVKSSSPGKRDPRDFALWKHAREGEPSWPSPWGRGRPGWHIECSAMVRETLGDQIDIHGGGADLIFPHHENEIAQSESLTHHAPFARHWTHAGLVTLGGGDKMAHSAENFTTLASILDRYDPLAVRYYLVATQYRSSLTFAVDEAVDGSVSVRGIEDARSAVARLRRALGDEPFSPEGPLDQASVDAFTEAMDADFNTPDALAVIFDLAREINTRRASGASVDELAPSRRTLLRLLGVLGLDIRTEAPSDQRPIDPYVDLLLEVRRKLRDVKQWQLADEICTRLTDLGVTVEDRPGGESTWRLDAP